MITNQVSLFNLFNLARKEKGIKDESVVWLQSDTETRWWSLFQMLVQFLQYYSPIKNALAELNALNKLDGFELKCLQELVYLLSPMITVHKKIAKANANMLDAYGTIEFLRSTFARVHSDLARRLMKNVEDKYVSRFEYHTYVLAYLAGKRELGEDEFDKLLDFCVTLLKRVRGQLDSPLEEIINNSPDSSGGLKSTIDFDALNPDQLISSFSKSLDQTIRGKSDVQKSLEQQG